jgi:hypothetical protein
MFFFFFTLLLIYSIYFHPSSWLPARNLPPPKVKLKLPPPKPQLQLAFLSNPTKLLIALMPTVHDTMIREALNVIQHQLLDNAGKYCSYNTKMSNSATIYFLTLFFSPRTWLGSWEATVNRRTWRHLSGSGSDFA